MTTKITTSIILLACLLAQSPNLFSQRTIMWKGGTPGKETQWQCPKNWTCNHVPDEFSNVTIPDVSSSSMAYPVLMGVAEVNSLRLEGNAALTIAPEGQLTVFTDVVVLHKENLQIKGTLIVLNELETSEKIIATLWEQ